jgi:hypothetical protein
VFAVEQFFNSVSGFQSWYQLLKPGNGLSEPIDSFSKPQDPCGRFSKPRWQVFKNPVAGFENPGGSFSKLQWQVFNTPCQLFQGKTTGLILILIFLF